MTFNLFKRGVKNRLVLIGRKRLRIYLLSLAIRDVDLVWCSVFRDDDIGLASVPSFFLLSFDVDKLDRIHEVYIRCNQTLQPSHTCFRIVWHPEPGFTWFQTSLTVTCSSRLFG